EDDERRRVLHEHGLAHEEITEIDGPLHVGVEPLLERQLDVAADGAAVPLLAAAIGRLHDARATPRDDGATLLGEHARGPPRLLVVRVVDGRAGRAADRYRV